MQGSLGCERGHTYGRGRGGQMHGAKFDLYVPAHYVPLCAVGTLLQLLLFVCTVQSTASSSTVLI